MKKNVIWSSDFEVSDFKEYLEEEYPDLDTDEEKYQIASDMNREYLNDERMNLDIQLDRPIIAIADIGLWNRRTHGYKVFDSCNIKDVLYSNYDDTEWFTDRYNLCGTVRDHDGETHIIYRQLRPERSLYRFLERILRGNFTTKMLNYYTETLVHRVNDVYGW